MAILRRSSLRLLHRHVARRHASSTTSSRLTIGIRREDPLRIWERRCPLTPDLVNGLVEKDGVKVLIEDCDRRVWNTSAFVEVCTTVAIVSSSTREVSAASCQCIRPASRDRQRPGLSYVVAVLCTVRCMLYGTGTS